jgi:hypothetical protein
MLESPFLDQVPCYHHEWIFGLSVQDNSWVFCFSIDWLRMETWIFRTRGTICPSASTNKFGYSAYVSTSIRELIHPSQPRTGPLIPTFYG